MKAAISVPEQDAMRIWQSDFGVQQMNVSGCPAATLQPKNYVIF